jgi:SAM-dependent methyltransferase
MLAPYLSNTSEQKFGKESLEISLSAAITIDHLLNILPIHSAIDIGCGVGLWLKALSDRGVEKVIGVDGDYTNRSRLVIDPACFISRDLNRSIDTIGLGKFDLAMSLEVGEHLLPNRADSLVDELCALSDFVVYGAAIKHQGGEAHINEQPQSYWVEKFRSRGYLPYDVLRPLIWNDRRVIWWYSQNTILYVRNGSGAHACFEKRFGSPPVSMFDVVHPDLYCAIAQQLHDVPRFIAKTCRSVRKRVNRS